MPAAPVTRLSATKIKELASRRCYHHHNFLEHYNCFLTENPTEERIGFFDIETSNLNANFGIMLAYCIKDSQSDKIYEDYLTKEDAFGNLDKRIVKNCIKDLLRFDRVIGHYSQRFDIPYVRTRALMLGVDFPGYGELMQSDTWQIARHKLKLNSNRLKTIALAILGKTEKTEIDPIYWLRGLQGNKKALKYIVHHCEMDVLDLEKIYNKLEKFTRTTKTSI